MPYNGHLCSMVISWMLYSSGYTGTNSSWGCTDVLAVFSPIWVREMPFPSRVAVSFKKWSNYVWDIKEKCFHWKSHWIRQEKVELWIFRHHLLGGGGKLVSLKILPVHAVKYVQRWYGEALCKIRYHVSDSGLIFQPEHFAWNPENPRALLCHQDKNWLVRLGMIDSLLLCVCERETWVWRIAIKITEHKDSKLIWGSLPYLDKNQNGAKIPK